MKRVNKRLGKMDWNDMNLAMYEEERKKNIWIILNEHKRQNVVT